jgi:hypothetical protein
MRPLLTEAMINRVAISSIRRSEIQGRSEFPNNGLSHKNLDYAVEGSTKIVSTNSFIDGVLTSAASCFVLGSFFILAVFLCILMNKTT